MMKANSVADASLIAMAHVIPWFDRNHMVTVGGAPLTRLDIGTRALASIDQDGALSAVLLSLSGVMTKLEACS